MGVQLDEELACVSREHRTVYYARLSLGNSPGLAPSEAVAGASSLAAPRRPPDEAEAVRGWWARTGGMSAAVVVFGRGKMSFHLTLASKQT